MAIPNTYIVDDTGTYIPATQRPDGSWRKARRVKDGYVPQDEMPLYESKGKQWAKSRPTLPVGLDPCYASPEIPAQPRKIPGLYDTSAFEPVVSKSKKKKKKKSSVATVTDQISELEIKTPEKVTKVVQPVTTDPAKRIRNLKKKLRDIEALKSKIKSGELENPDPDQLEKIKRQEEIEAEIEELESELGDN